MRKKALIFISIGLLLAFFRIAGSDAFSVVNILRTSSASTIVADSSAFLSPVGFNNSSFILTTTYLTVGTIKNNTKQTLSLRVYVDPNITTTRNTSTTWTLNVRLTNAANTTIQTLTFSGTGVGNPAAQWSNATSLATGVTYNIRCSLTVSSKQNFLASVAYGFEGITTNILTINIQDSINNPRKQSYTAQ